MRCTFPRVGTPVCCAVSGGADSTALAVLAVAAGCVVEIVHVDHGLRPGSADEFAFVQATAARLGVSARSVPVSVEQGPNMEARARAARAAVLPHDALTGHTADDQAETVLINLLRGSALDGLAGMRRGHRHPLLDLRRTDTVALCEMLDLAVVHDESNDDVRLLRNRIRHEVLPSLRDVARRDLVPVLTRQADLLRDDADLLEALAAEVDVTDAATLTAAPRPLARRAVRRWLALELGGPPVDGATVERVLQVAAGDVIACQVPGGARVERHRQRLSVVPAPFT